MKKSTMPKFFLALVAIFMLGCIGCCDKGPANYQLSGTISYKGRPVPRGEVFLRPIGNGPGGFAIINDGKYKTIAGRGYQGGLSKITFHGFGKVTTDDGRESGGLDLFPPYTVEIDLPEEDFVYSLKVPPGKKR